MVRTTRKLPDGGAAPPPPPELPPIAADEGPMRGDLRRQIGELERALGELEASSWRWKSDAASPTRGPAVLGGADLERVRDELVIALTSLRHELAGRELD